MRSRRSSWPSWSNSALALAAAPSVRTTDFWASVVFSVVSRDTVTPTRSGRLQRGQQPPALRSSPSYVRVPATYRRGRCVGPVAPLPAAPLPRDAGGELGKPVAGAVHRRLD